MPHPLLLSNADLSSHTTEAFQDEVEFATSLEGIDEVHNEGVLDGL